VEWAVVQFINIYQLQPWNHVIYSLEFIGCLIAAIVSSSVHFSDNHRQQLNPKGYITWHCIWVKKRCNLEYWSIYNHGSIVFVNKTCNSFSCFLFSCSVWQHIECMGISSESLPENYLCEQCEPRYSPFYQIILELELCLVRITIFLSLM